MSGRGVPSVWDTNPTRLSDFLSLPRQEEKSIEMPSIGDTTVLVRLVQLVQRPSMDYFDASHEFGFK
jgi:hypothetical protein